MTLRFRQTAFHVGADTPRAPFRPGEATDLKPWRHRVKTVERRAGWKTASRFSQSLFGRRRNDTSRQYLGGRAPRTQLRRSGIAAPRATIGLAADAPDEPRLKAPPHRPLIQVR